MVNDKGDGLIDKYKVIKNSTGEPIEEACFVVIPAKDKHARAAIRAYADSCAEENPTLALDLTVWIIGIETAEDIEQVKETHGWYYAMDIDDIPQYLEHSNATNYSGPFPTSRAALVHYMETRADQVSKLRDELGKANRRYTNYVRSVEDYHDDSFA